MLDVFHIPKPQGCDIQIFYGSDTSTSGIDKTWVKPRGVSHVYFLLIGCGGNGDGTTGGGSGAVTVWYGSANNVPDSLYVRTVLNSATGTAILFNLPSGSRATLLNAAAGNASTAGTATTANYFAASGFYQSIQGQGGNSAAIIASTTTFLGGGGTAASSLTANYGYSLPSAVSAAGFFQMQPIIVGAGGKGAANGGIGCGGGAGGAAKGGPGMVLIASW